MIDTQIALLVAGIFFIVVFTAIVIRFGAIWFLAYMTGADVSVASLIGMSLRQVEARLIVRAKIIGSQAGLNIDRKDGMSTARLEAHVLAGGDAMRVLQSLVVANRAGIDLEFDRAAAIDLAGRDVLEAVRNCVLPIVIDCPSSSGNERNVLSAVAKNGVELLVRARVTVRTNFEQLIGGATEETIVARVCQGIVTAIGSAQSHTNVLEMPERISKEVFARGLDTNTAFEIISIDIADVDVGRNIGARLQTDQAAADTRVAEARAEKRKAEAIARQQEMQAKIAEFEALLLLAEADIPEAIATAFRAGQLFVDSPRLPLKFDWEFAIGR